MWKLVLVATGVLYLVSPVPAQTVGDVHPIEITSEEEVQAQQIAVRATTRLEESGDFGAVVDELFADDFIRRYIEDQKRLGESPDGSTDCYFAPGLYYDSQLLNEATPENWRRLYIAVQSFVLRGIFVALNRSAHSLLAGDAPPDSMSRNIYPPGVIQLLDDDPILRNFVEKKGASRPIKTVQEMQQVTAILERGLAILDQADERLRYSLTEDSRKLVKVLEQPGPLRQFVDVPEESSFGYPAGTRFIRIVTPLMFQLTLTNEGGSMRILWAEPYTGE